MEPHRFFSDLCAMIYGGPIGYCDLYHNHVIKQYRPGRTAALQFMLENLNLDVALPIPDQYATPADLFALSVIWGAEVALTLNGDQLHVISQGRRDRVRAANGHITLAHTHPTDSTQKSQVEGDCEVAGIGRAEIVIAESIIIYITRDAIINAKRGDNLQALDVMCVARTTPLSASLFKDLYQQYIQTQHVRGSAEIVAAKQLWKMRMPQQPDHDDEEIDPFDFI
jgi:hypothetical protein